MWHCYGKTPLRFQSRVIAVEMKAQQLCNIRYIDPQCCTAAAPPIGWYSVQVYRSGRFNADLCTDFNSCLSIKVSFLAQPQGRSSDTAEPILWAHCKSVNSAVWEINCYLCTATTTTICNFVANDTGCPFRALVTLHVVNLKRPHRIAPPLMIIKGQFGGAQCLQNSWIASAGQLELMDIV